MIDKAIYKAQEINGIIFAESLYYPNEDDYHKYKSNNFKDAIFHYISIEMRTYLFDTNDGGRDSVGQYRIKKSFHVPEDPAERAENALKLLNMVLHSYPFGQSIWYGDEFNEDQLVGSRIHHLPINWSETPPKPIIFSNYKDIKIWFSDFKELCDQMHFSIYHLCNNVTPSCTRQIDALANSKLEEIQKDNLLFKSMGYSNNPIDPKYIFNDFLVKFPKACELANSLKIHIEKIDKYKENKFPQNITIIIFIIIIFVTFCCGAIIPLIFSFNNEFIQVKLPAFIYTLFLGYVLWSIYNMIRFY
jgi:hypothetical protein